MRIHPNETVCPWCGEELVDAATQSLFAEALEDHVTACDVWLSENNSTHSDRQDF